MSTNALPEIFSALCAEALVRGILPLIAEHLATRDPQSPPPSVEELAAVVGFAQAPFQAPPPARSPAPAAQVLRSPHFASPAPAPSAPGPRAPVPAAGPPSPQKGSAAFPFGQCVYVAVRSVKAGRCEKPAADERGYCKACLKKAAVIKKLGALGAAAPAPAPPPAEEPVRDIICDPYDPERGLFLFEGLIVRQGEDVIFALGALRDGREEPLSDADRQLAAELRFGVDESFFGRPDPAPGAGIAAAGDFAAQAAYPAAGPAQAAYPAAAPAQAAYPAAGPAQAAYPGAGPSQAAYPAAGPAKAPSPTQAAPPAKAPSPAKAAAAGPASTFDHFGERNKAAATWAEQQAKVYAASPALTKMVPAVPNFQFD